jgi:hypothetical protein
LCGHPRRLGAPVMPRNTSVQFPPQRPLHKGTAIAHRAHGMIGSRYRAIQCPVALTSLLRKPLGTTTVGDTTTLRPAIIGNRDCPQCLQSLSPAPDIGLHPTHKPKGRGGRASGGPLETPIHPSPGWPLRAAVTTECEREDRTAAQRPEKSM